MLTNQTVRYADLILSVIGQEELAEQVSNHRKKHVDALLQELSGASEDGEELGETGDFSGPENEDAEE